MTSPDRSGITCMHDPAGNVVGRTDARGISATFSYDALDRLSAMIRPSHDATP